MWWRERYALESIETSRQCSGVINSYRFVCGGQSDFSARRNAIAVVPLPHRRHLALSTRTSAQAHAINDKMCYTTRTVRPSDVSRAAKLVGAKPRALSVWRRRDPCNRRVLFGRSRMGAPRCLVQRHAAQLVRVRVCVCV